MERIIPRPIRGRSIMKRAAFGLLCLLVLVPAAAFADSLDSAAPYCAAGTCPSTFTVNDVGQLLVLKGTGNLLGTVDTKVILDGRAGTYTEDIVSASAVDGDNGTLLVTILVAVPDQLLTVDGHYSATIEATDASAVRTFGPVYF